jgi:hypothetical protein
VFCTWMFIVFWISPVWISSPLRWVLMLSNSWWVEVDRRGGGNPSESDDWACCSCHSDPLASCHPDPPASYGCRVYPRPYPYLGVNPSVFMVGSHPDMCVIGGTGGVSVGGGCCELPASCLVRLCVDLRETVHLRASSCSTRVKVLTLFFGTCQDGQSGLIGRRKVTVYADSRWKLACKEGCRWMVATYGKVDLDWGVADKVKDVIADADEGRLEDCCRW